MNGYFYLFIFFFFCLHNFDLLEVNLLMLHAGLYLLVSRGTTNV